MGLRVDLTPYVASESEEEEQEEQTEEPDVQMVDNEQPCPPSTQEEPAKVESMDVSKVGEQAINEGGETAGNSGTSSPSAQMLSSPNPTSKHFTLTKKSNQYLSFISIKCISVSVCLFVSMFDFVLYCL